MSGTSWPLSFRVVTRCPCTAGGPRTGRSRWPRGLGASAGFRQTQEWGQAEGAAAPKGPPMCCCCRGAVACGADVCVAVRPAWGLPFFLSWRVRRQRRASKLRAANGYVRSGMCRSPPSEVLLTFQRHPRWSRRAAVSLGRSLRPSVGVSLVGTRLVCGSRGASPVPKPPPPRLSRSRWRLGSGEGHVSCGSRGADHETLQREPMEVQALGRGSGRQVPVVRLPRMQR